MLDFLNLSVFACCTLRSDPGIAQPQLAQFPILKFLQPCVNNADNPTSSGQETPGPGQRWGSVSMAH